MNEALIRGSFKVVCPLLAILSLLLLLRGHDLSGGGFIGGLVLSLAMILHFISQPDSKLKKWIYLNYTSMIAISILVLIFVLIIPIALGKAGLSSMWTSIPFPIAGKISSVLVFDSIVFIIVSSSTTMAYVKFISFSKENGS
ncbi:MnhB domain-containing protein [Halobacteriovorax sp. ZH4_bin.1]|uniref:MnhB domain-containing protein n=1 Tax=unclassified Halobacteriovorax TaxID=2639665 RepID=UPI00371C5EEF